MLKEKTRVCELSYTVFQVGTTACAVALLLLDVYDHEHFHAHLMNHSMDIVRRVSNGVYIIAAITFLGVFYKAYDYIKRTK